jgi:hypothetical protein
MGALIDDDVLADWKGVCQWLTAPRQHIEHHLNYLAGYLPER